MARHAASSTCPDVDEDTPDVPFTIDPNAKPSALWVEAAGIPAEMRAADRWVAWRWERRDDRWTKVPVNAKAGARASSTDPATWAPFAVALAAYNRGGVDGVGFVLGDGWVGVDVDEAGHEAEILELNTYAEHSAGLGGLHAILHGSLPPGGRRRGPWETYESGRYFTVTGHRLEGSPAEVVDATEALAALHAKYVAKDRPADGAVPQPSTSAGLDDGEVVRRASTASNGAKFVSLYFSGAGGGDESAADLALCNMLAFWCGPQGEAQVHRIFSKSALYREKWDSRRGDSTYGWQTVEKAYSNSREFYTAPGSSGEWHHAGQRPDGTYRPGYSAPDLDDDGDGEIFPDAQEPFPVDALPPIAREFVEAQVGHWNCDPGAYAAPALSAIAVAFGGYYALDLHFDNERQSPVLWLATVGVQGSGKSPSARRTFEPLMEMQREWQAKHAAKRSGSGSLRDTWPPPEQPETKSKKEKAEDCPQLVLSEGTWEAVVNRLAQNPTGILWHADELMTIVKGVDQYKQGRGSSSSEMLSAWSGETIIRERVEKGQLIIDNPVLNIFGTTQPHKVGEIGDTESGVLARYLLLPIGPAGDVSRTPLDRRPFEAWSTFIKQAVRSRQDGGSVIFSHESAEAWHDEMESWAIERRGIASAEADGFKAKYGIHAARLALVHHLGRGWPEEPITVESVHAGCKLARYFVRAQIRYFEPINPGAGPAEAAVTNLALKLHDALTKAGGSMTRRDLQRKRVLGRMTGARMDSVIAQWQGLEFGSVDREMVSGKLRVTLRQAGSR